MNIVNDMMDMPAKYKGNTFLALGNFDGVHRGHQAVISETIRMADRYSGASAVLLLDPHPGKVINPDGGLMLLADLPMKAELFDKLGVDYIIVEPFTNAVANLAPADFFYGYLLSKIRVKGIVCGFDYSFGKNAAGDISLLKKLTADHSIPIAVCSPETDGDNPVSSSSIRKLILEGRLKEASLLLNYFFYREGTVVPGDGRGETIGFPTANLQIPPDLILPGKGVYVTVVQLNNILYLGATNIGNRPTFQSGQVTVETHILDFCANLYGNKLKIYFLEKIRNEEAFSDTRYLQEQLKKDIEKVQIYRECLNDFPTGFFKQPCCA